MLLRTHMLILAGLMTSTVYAQYSVPATLRFSKTGSSSGGGTVTSSTSGIAASTAVAGRYTSLSEAAANIDWYVDVEWTGTSNGSPTVAGSYSLSLQDSAFAEVECLLTNGSMAASGNANGHIASASVTGVDYDYESPIDSSMYASGSLASMTMTFIGGKWVGSLKVKSTTLSSSSSLTNPSGMGSRTSYGSGAASQDIYSYLGSATVTPKP